MINLLPPEQKKEIIAGRSNALLLRYVFLSLGVFVALCALLVFVYFSLSAIKDNAQTTIDENNRAVANYKDVEKKSAQFKRDLTVAKNIFNRQNDYSGATMQLAGLLPEGSVASSLTLDPAIFTKPTQLTFRAKSYDIAIKLKDSLLNSDMFSDAHFVSITDSRAAGGTTSGAPENPYPLIVSMNVQFKKQGAPKP